MNCNTTHYRANSSSVPGDPTSLPQSVTVALLEQRLAAFPSATFRRGVAFRELRQEADRVRVLARDEVTGLDLAWETRYVIGCDGHRSAVRASAGIPVDEHYYPQRFAMADFDDRTDLADEAHLFFSAEASVESFPLPHGRRRWIVMLNGPLTGEPAAAVVAGVGRITGYDLAACPPRFQTTFQTRRAVAQSFHRGRVVLAGDAAHVMSPVGGQGMNTGFADAELLAALLPAVARAPARAAAQFDWYDRVRRRAFDVAAARAARGMWLGTRRGRVCSRLRRVVIRDLLFSRWLRPKLAPYFAMLTIPAPRWSPVSQEVS